MRILNSKHPHWRGNSHPSDITHYNFIVNTGISLNAPTSPNLLPNVHNHRLDVLDISHAKLPHPIITAISLNQLSDDHNYIVLEITDSPIASSLPPHTSLINWNKFFNTLNHLLKGQNTVVYSIINIENTVSDKTFF